MGSFFAELPPMKPVYLLYAALGYIIWKVTYHLILYPYFLSPLRQVPGPPLRNPLFGVIPQLIMSEPGLPPRDWLKQYGSVVRVVEAFGGENVVFSSPDALEKMLVSGWLDFPRPAYARQILGLVAGEGLLTVTGDEHKQMRKAIVPAFSIPNLMTQTEMYYDAIEGLVEVFRKGITDDPTGSKVFPVYEWMGKATLDIICSTAFGYHTDTLHNPHDALASAYEELLSLQSNANLAGLLLLLSIPYFPQLLRTKWAYTHGAAYFKLVPLLRPLGTILSCMHTIRTISRDMLRQKMREAEEDADGSAVLQDGDMLLGGKRDIMSLLVRARVADARRIEREKSNLAHTAKIESLGVRQTYMMSDDDMVEQVLTFLGAGHETTASALTWTLWLLANDLEAQQRLREEVTPILDANPRPDYRTLKSMTWLDCVVNESLRVMPPAPTIARMAASDQHVDGVFIPKGTHVDIQIRAINTLKATWGEDAEEFRPQRWLNLPETHNSTYSMLTFITGPHGCIGKTMAIMEAKAVLAALITNFIFEPAFAGQVAQPTAAITMKPKDNMPLRVRCVERVT